MRTPAFFAWFISACIILLAAVILGMTFMPRLPTEPGFSLSHWAVLASPRLLTQVLPNTAIVGFGAIAVAAGFALPLAWLLTRTAVPFREGFTSLIAAIVIVPGFVLAMGWVMLIDPRIGLLNAMLAHLFAVDVVPVGINNNVFGIAWVVGLVLVPPLFFLVAGPMRAIDPTLEEAAATCGATRWTIFRRVDAPLLVPATCGGLIYIFMTAVSIFDIPGLLGAGAKVPVLAGEIFYTVRPVGAAASYGYGAAGVYGVLLAVPSLIALQGYLRLVGRRDRYQVIAGRAYRPGETGRGQWRWLGFAFMGLYALLGLLLPLAILVWMSLMPSLRIPSLDALRVAGFYNYHDLFGSLGGWHVLQNTAALAIATALLTTFFSFMVSYIVVRSTTRLRKTLDSVVMLPHAIPSIGFGFALAMLGIAAARWLAWFPFAGTIGIIVIAHVVTRLPYGSRMTNATLLQVHQALEEAAYMSGASTLITMRRILLPLIKPALTYLLIWTALLSTQEVTMALFLSGPRNEVLSVSIWDLWQGGNLGAAAAGAVSLVVVLGTGTWMLLRCARPNSHARDQQGAVPIAI